jgi:broad specificity phosphatase PhoE
LTLLCHAATAAMRSGAFPAPEDPLDDGGMRKARGYRLAGGGIDLAMVSPAFAARQTAEALGLGASVVHSLRDIDHGEWAGQGFEAIRQRDPGALAGWLADPARGAPGGESLADLLARVVPWLEAQADRDLHIAAITHPMIVRAVLAAALDIAPAATMRIDIAPLTAVRLSFHRAWRLQSIGSD